MLRWLRIVVRLALLVLWIVLGLLAVGVAYPLTSPSSHVWMNRQWSRGLLRLCGVRTKVAGSPVQDGAVLYVANHVSWLDIFIINAVRPTAFVAKDEIRTWPVVGRLVKGADTLFIARGQRRAMHAVGLAMKARFEQGRAVGLFPEGTTSDGTDVLPFHAGLFEAARGGGASVQPLALDYQSLAVGAPFPAFTGDETLVSNVIRLLGERRWHVQMRYQMPIDIVPTAQGEAPTRFELADQSYRAVKAGLQCPPDARV